MWDIQYFGQHAKSVLQKQRIAYVAELRIDLGEKIHLRSIVKARCEQEIPFLIRAARYELIDAKGQLEDSGDCTIADHELDALIQPKKIGTYKFKYIYEVADEIWIDVIKLVVN